jgi:uncharacterized protein (TIGR03083 family)
MTEGGSQRDLALTWIRTAAAGFAHAGRYLRSIPESEWDGPSGASEWTIRDLAGHIVGEVVWFPNLVRGVTRNEEPYPMSLYEDLKALPPDEMADRIEAAAVEAVPAVEEATDEQLEKDVDLGFTKMPLWRATFVSAVEGVFHDWDTRARREPKPQVPDEWARVLAGPLTEFAPFFAHRSQVPRFPGTYLLDVSGGVGPVTVIARDGDLSVEHGSVGTADVTLHLTPDQYVRLLVGRLDLRGRESDIPVDGDRERLSGLASIFGGIANGD